MGVVDFRGIPGNTSSEVEKWDREGKEAKNKFVLNKLFIRGANRIL